MQKSMEKRYYITSYLEVTSSNNAARLSFQQVYFFANLIAKL